MKESVDDAKKGAQGAEFTLMRRMSGLQTNVLNGIQSVLEDKTKNAACEPVPSFAACIFANHY
jgi:hypothetical protein